MGSPDTGAAIGSPDGIRLTRAKLTPPSRVTHPIDRVAPSLADGVPRGTRLVLCNAPAGFGKTSVMLQWREQLERAGMATAWLTLDPQDNDLSRFLTYLAAALGDIGRASDVPPLPASLFDSQIVPSGVVLDLLERLSGCGQPFALFVDDYECVANEAIHAIVRQLIDHQPPGCRLVIGSRSTPPLGLGRLRVREQLVELGIEQLRFSLAETAAYLNTRREQPVPERDIQALHQCTEGWATALQLATLSLSGARNPGELLAGVSGSNAGIADYLAEDVLSRLDPVVRDFLLDVCVLDTLTVPLCEAVSGRPDCAAQLEAIERANLFLIPLDAERTTWRFHNLFADFLRTQLERRRPGQSVERHRRAAQAYLSQNRVVPAVEHALAADDTRMAAELLDAHAETLLYAGRVDTLARWVETLPPDCLDDLPHLRLSYTWALTFLHRYQEARSVLDEFRHAGERQLTAREKDEVLTLGPAIQIFSDRIDECQHAATHNLPRLSGKGDFAHGALCNIAAFCLGTESRFDEAAELLATAKRLFLRAGSTYGWTYSQCLEGAMEFAQGRSAGAQAIYANAFQRATGGTRYSSASAVAAVHLAELLYLNEDPSGAEDLLNDYLPIIEQTGLPDHIIVANRILARLSLARQDVEAAQRRLNDMEYLGIAREAPRIVATSRIERAWLAMAIGDLEQASRLLEQARRQAHWAGFGHRIYHGNETEDLELHRARLALRTHQPREAADILAAQLTAVAKTRRHRRRLLLQMLEARAWLELGQHAKAQYQFAAAWDEARALGVSGQIQDDRALLQPLLARLAPGGQTEPAELPPLPNRSDDPDALTERELQVLRLVAEGLSNRAMAETLFVSEATVKTHLRSINGKLGAHSRTQAVAMGRAKRIL